MADRNKAASWSSFPQAAPRDYSGAPDFSKSPLGQALKKNKLFQRGRELVAQTAQGFLLPFTANNVEPGKPQKPGLAPPVAVDFIPALVGTGIQLASGGKRKPIPYIQRAQQRVANADQVTNERLGIEAPDDPLEFGMNILGSLLIPGPKVFKAGPKSSTGIKIAAEVGNTVAEAVLPFRQGGSLAKTAAVQVPLGLGLIEGVDAAFQNPEYSGFRNAITGEDDPDPNAPPSAKEQPLTSFIPQELQAIYQEAEAADDLDLMEEVLDLAEEEQDKAAAAEYLPEKPDWADEIAVVAGLGALGLGVAGIKRFTARQAIKALHPADELVGTRVNRPVSSPLTKLKQGAIQHDQATRDALRKAIPDDVQYEQMLARMDRVTAPSVNTITQHAFSTGELPKATPKRAIVPTLEAYASELSPIEQRMVRDSLLAASALDDINRTNKQAAFNDLTPQQLQQKVAVVANDPKLSKYADAIRSHYRDELDFRLERGLITPEEHARMIKERPNYVHMSRNQIEGNDQGLLWGQGKKGFSSNKTVESFTRATEADAGVQMANAADPVAELPGRMAQAIREAEINDVKKDVMEILSSSKALQDHVKLVSVGAAPNSMENVHSVLVKGVPHYYKVTDPALNTALEFMPFASRGFISSALGVPKKMAEFFITGPGAPLFATTSSFYDTISGIALRPKNYDLGVLAEFKNKMLDPNQPGWVQAMGRVVPAGGPLSTFDPTTWVSAPIGAVRLAKDSITESLANDLTTRLLKDNDWLVQALGPQNARMLRDRLASAYDGSIKSIMDEYGARTANYYGSVDPNSLGRGMIDAAPRFTSEASKRAYEDAMRGGTGFVEGMFKASQSGWVQARASTLARLYTGTVRLLHEGFRYQAFATNLPKVMGDDELTQLLASQTRRLAGDVGQTGGAQWYQELSNAALYMNVGVQEAAQWGRMLSKQPLTTITNVTAAIGAMSLMQYLWAASDDAAVDDLASSTDEENARQVKTFGGLTIPVPPTLRMVWGPYSAIVNEVTGINDGMYDPNFAAAFEAWADDDYYMSETGQTSLAESWRAAWQSAMPLTTGSSPAVNAAAGLAGFDINFSRFTGEPMLIEGQKLSQLGGEGKLVNDALSAQSQKVIQDLMGTTVADFVRTGLDAQRAFGEGATGEEALRVALSRMKDNTVRSAGPLRGMIFGDYERLQPFSDTDQKLWYAKREGFEKARATLRQDLVNQYMTGADERYAQLRPSELVDPANINTALLPIGELSAELGKQLYDLERQESELKKLADSYKNEFFSSIEERNLQVNAVNEERRAIQEQMLNVTRLYEDQIRKAIGDPTFNFQDFDPQKYQAMPYQPVAAIPPQ